jgi:methionine-rich copper-binding protein CopC
MTATAVRRRAALLLLATLLLTLLVGLTLVSVAGPAWAHDVLRSSSPADGTHVERPPAEVVLTFDEPALTVGTEVLVTGPSGAVATGPPRLVDNEVRQSLTPGPAGAYTVVWRVTSADGHPVSGTFGFTADQPSASATSSASTTTAATAPTATATATATTTAPASATAAPTVEGASGVAVLAVVAMVVIVASGAVVVGWTVRRQRSGGGPRER